MATKKPTKEEDGVNGEANLVSPAEILNTQTFDFSVKENLLALHKILLDLNVRSIGDLEVLIGRA